MKTFAVVLLFLLNTIITKRYEISVQNLDTDKAIETTDYLEQDNEDSTHVSFELTESLRFIKEQKKGSLITLTFTNQEGETLVSSLNLVKHPKTISGLKLQLFISNSGVLHTIGIVKIETGKASTFEVKRKTDLNLNVEIENLAEIKPKRHRDDGTGSQAEEKKPEEEQSFLKKYFWYIVIGGMVVMNLASFDKTKLNDAYQQAQQQANAQRN